MWLIKFTLYRRAWYFRRRENRRGGRGRSGEKKSKIKNNNFEDMDHVRRPSGLDAARLLVPTCKDTTRFLHTRPEIGSNRSRQPLTCVLSDGSRVFLKRRADRLSSLGIKYGSTDASSSGKLLSKTMIELLQEAKDMQVMSVAAKSRKVDTDNSIEGNAAEEGGIDMELDGVNLKLGTDRSKGIIRPLHASSVPITL